MTNRPILFPEWSLKKTFNGKRGEPNIMAPTPIKIDYGFNDGEIPFRESFNWLFNNISEWIKYLDFKNSDLERVLFDIKNKKIEIPGIEKIQDMQVSLDIIRNVLQAQANSAVSLETKYKNLLDEEKRTRVQQIAGLESRIALLVEQLSLLKRQV